MPKPKAKLLFQVHPYLNSSGKGREIVEFAKNRKLFSQGDPSKTVFYLREGAVKLTVINENGKEAVIALLGSGDFLGEGCGKRKTLPIIS
jgi:CRP/FNR family transcriptional regulator, cyclic AMP receptor protein